MSLEQQIGALVKASENLTGAVNGKIGEIDHKVEQSIEELNNAFPVKYKEFSIRSHFVDCINGNDSNTGKSWESSFRTIDRALKSGEGAQSQRIWLSLGKHIINTRVNTYADIVRLYGQNQLHYPSGGWSEETSSVLHFDKREDVRNSISTKLFGNLYVNNVIITFEGMADSTDEQNTAFYGLGNIGLRLPLFVFDSVNRGIMTTGNNYNPFSSLGCELPQFTGEAAYHVKGSGSTCILNLDRSVDRTSGMNQKFGSVVVLG